MKETTQVGRSLFGGRGLTIAIVVCAAIAVCGIALWVFQVVGGLAVTNMRNLASWGLYIVMFMFLVGLSAGGLIISSAPRVFGLKGFGGISKVAVWSSICCTVLAAAFVIVDMGQPLRIWELIVQSNFTSPLMWDVTVIATYLTVSIVYLVLTVRAEKGACSPRALRVISTVALVTAVLVHSVTAWIFGLQAGRGMWNTALLAPWFVSSALVCGVALVIIVVIALRRAGYMDIAQENIVKMAKLLGVFLCVDLYFFGCDLLTEGYAGGHGAEIVSMLVAGPLAPFFWIEVLGGIAAIAIAFTPQLRTSALLVVASLLGIVGIFCKRVQLLVGGFQIPSLEYVAPVLPGSPVTDAGAAMQALASPMVYMPAPFEMALVLAVVAFGSCLFLLGIKYLPLKPAAESC